MSQEVHSFLYRPVDSGQSSPQQTVHFQASLKRFKIIFYVHSNPHPVPNLHEFIHT